MERLVRGRAPRRDFDEQFWQALGPGRILEAAWDLVVTAASAKGIHEDQLRLPDVFYPIGMEPGSLPTWNLNLLGNAESSWISMVSRLGSSRGMTRCCPRRRQAARPQAHQEGAEAAQVEMTYMAIYGVTEKTVPPF